MYPMARSLRIQLAGGVYHVTSRGDEREAIYLSDDDRPNKGQTPINRPSLLALNSPQMQ